MPDPSHPDAPKPIGGAASPSDTDEVRPIRVAPASEATAAAPKPAPAPVPVPASDGYELEVDPFPEVELPPRPVPIPEPPVDRPKVRARPKPEVAPIEAEEGGSTEFVTEVSEVDPVWSRAGEWGPDLVRVLAVGLGTLFVCYFLGFGGLGLVVFLAGGAAAAVLSYPLMITVERPVRITPEQAVVDFFAAASHHFPSYRRMWLLLSVSARQSGNFATFEAFRDHWRGRIAHWRKEAGVGKYTPLKFAVDGFRADKSAGKETSRAEYTVHVTIRDREDVGPIESYKMAHGLVKGPDRMWYLNRGVLDRRSKSG